MHRTSFVFSITFVLATLSFVVASCTEEGATPASEELDDDFVRIVVGHAVEDFETWRTRFDSHKSAREQAGIDNEQVLRGEDMPNLVFFMATAPSKEVAEQFLRDPNLARSMEFSGVEGEVVEEVLAPGTTYEAFEEYGHRLLVRHPVVDFERWMDTFEGHEVERAEAGVHEQLVTHPVGDPNDVYMMFGVSDADKVTDYMSSSMLRLTMRLAGVTGEPQAYFVRMVD